MKSMWNNLKFNPRELKYNVENESMKHKGRIIVSSAVMLITAASLGAYYDDLSFRSDQAQRHYLAGDEGYEPPQKFPDVNGDYMWSVRENLAILKGKSLKDLKYVEEGWPNRVVDVERPVSKYLINVYEETRKIQ